MKFNSQNYSAFIKNGKTKFQTKDEMDLIDGLRFSYSTCEIYNIRKPLDDPQQIELDHISDLRVGDSIIVTNNMYGCSALRTFWISATVLYIRGSCIGIDVILPPHIMRRSTGLIVLKRTVYHDSLPIQNLEIQLCVGGAFFLFNVHCDHFKMFLKIQMSENSSRIEIQSKTVYLENCKLFHQSIVIESPLVLKDLHLKNRALRQLKKGELKDDVWLWKEGCRSGTPQSEWILQHTSNIACIEVITSGRGFPWKTVTPLKTPQVVVNLEHYQAQRFRQHTILHDPSFSEFKELSAPTYSKGVETNHTFNLYLGSNLPPIPRLMLAPKGFRAVHVWTEHADSTIAETHRAVYYGDEKILDAEQAVGGFVKHGHVVTKSIFYDNARFDNIACQYRFSPMPLPVVSYQTDTQFRCFIDALSVRGHEICLHTATPDNGTPQETQCALVKISERYKSSSWIDHDIQGVRACLSYEGAMQHSPYNMLKFWQANKIRYFWHSASEDFMPKKKDSIDLLHLSSGDYTPTPLYWRIHSLPRDLITWAANECPIEYYKESTIDDLIQNRGVSIHHHYYPMLHYYGEHYNYGFMEKNKENRYVITKNFDDILHKMAIRRDAGELYITTIGEIVSYWLAIEQVQIDLLPEGFMLINTGDQEIKGLAFVVRANSVECLDIPIQSRYLDNDDILIWCDMPVGARYRFLVQCLISSVVLLAEKSI